ncbi:hypothetical protein QOZ80_3AG0207350 [Eleusine coracana subsp. coracana]|nr:hypothetical protein QOZ80_3AG0207350 [Eleusine coracana subsp. coracana]
MARTDWEADKMLDVYIYDYLVKRNLQATAKAFISEGKVATDPVAIDAPGGFLFEWWSIFWDIFHSTTKSSSSSSSVSLNNNNPMMLQHPPPGSGPGINSSDVTAVLASKMMMQDRLRHPNSDHHHLLDPNTRMALLTKSPPPNHQSHSGPPPLPQQIHPRNQQQPHRLCHSRFTREISSNLASNLICWTKSRCWECTSERLASYCPRMGSPAPSGSPNVRSDDPDYLMKLKMAQMQQCSGLRVPELPHQQNTRKRKPTSSGAANNTGTGNTVGPSPPSTPSTHTPGGGVPVASNVNTAQKSSMICGTGGTSGLASSSNQMDNLDSFVDFDENVDSFLSNDDGDGRGMFAALKKGSFEQNSESLNSLSLSEVGNNRTSTNKVVCCHFSTDGKLLASAGHEKKVFLWNMDNFKMDTKIEDHTNFITDIRFKTNSTQLATSSSDGTVRLWNAADETGALQTFHGHSSHVTSVDFHPRLTEYLCSCDDTGEIRFWTVGQTASSNVFRVKQGGNGRVRFQPRSGQLLAVAAGSIVNIFDVEKQANLHSPPKGHNSEINCICWDGSGEYLASVSQDTLKVWSIASGTCIHELRSHGNQYQSCTFHPRYPKVLIVGGYQTLELWSLGDNQRNPIQAHEGLIAALAHSPFTKMIASASHDRYVKLWK